MRYRQLGNTGIQVSEISFGCGPVPGLLTANSGLHQQLRTIARAVELGVNWFDTAATYGDGRSEENLGAAVEQLGFSDRVHIATKVRLFPEHMSDIRSAVHRSVEASLKRL